MTPTIFHLAFPVHDLKKAEAFYVKGIGCRPGRLSKHALILNFYGHQIVAQLSDPAPPQKGIYPRYFGLVLTRLADWKRLLSRLRKKKLPFYQEPHVRHEGTPIAHRTFFLKDPSNNLLEFKHYLKPSAVFGATKVAKVGDRS